MKKRPILILDRHKTLANSRIVRMFSCILAILTLALIALFAGLKTDTVSAQADRNLKNPPDLKSQTSAERGGDLNFTLEVKYADFLIPNPSTGQNDKVHLRSYNGNLVGPTMRVLPGELLRVNLVNNLPADDPSCRANQSMEIPHCFNSTNLHTHGWHVSPSGNSDNVLLDMKPGTSLDYEFYLPKDHPAGTFWYHSHRHGSTALQVSSGMVGTLIVDGFRQLKDKAVNGIADIDTILKDQSGRRFEDRIFMFEQTQYACLDSAGKIITDPATKRWVCPAGQVGGIEQYGPQFGSKAWSSSGRFTSINGMIQPEIVTETGKIERWRLIDGGVHDTINFRLARTNLAAATQAEIDKELDQLKKMSPAEQSVWIKNTCNLAQGVKQLEFAVDGLTRKQMSGKIMNVLQPGYRSDVLVAFDQPGIYCALDDATPPEGSINAPLVTKSNFSLAAAKSLDLNDTRLLALVLVSGGTPYKGDAQEYVANKLIAANQDLPEPVRNDLKTLRVPEFVPHADIPADKNIGKQELSFGILTASDGSTLFQIANKANPLQHDFYSYDANRVDRLLTLGGTDEWTLTSGSVGHPFHIHVNPFQIIQILKPDGTPVVDANGKCTDGTDPQYCDQIGIFRDTLFVKNPIFDPTGQSKGYTIIVRTRYERYIGDFVLHCHILDHEDGGMMQNVRIAPKGGYLEGNPAPMNGTMKHNH